MGFMTSSIRYLQGKSSPGQLFDVSAACIALSTIAALSPSSAWSQCPAYGNDTTCGTIITITDAGASVSFTGQGPYDGSDDTLVGVINNSSVPITSMVLMSGTDIFGFDGDGIDTYGAPGNSKDSTGYGGPNAYFTNINASSTSGTVNFIIPIAAKVGTAYFSLEEALAQATACTSVINGSVPAPNGAGTPTISTTFTPKLGYTISKASQLCGFTNFDWQQTIVALPLPSPYVSFAQRNMSPQTPLSAPPSFLDPPANGGYAYQVTNGSAPTGDYSYPFYLNPNLNPGQSGSTELVKNESGDTILYFSDTPADPCLFGGNPTGHATCNGKTAAAGALLGFQTHLVGVTSTNTAIDTGIGFTWTSSFNGTSGGVATTKTSAPADPGSGTGAAQIVQFNSASSYSYPKTVSVTVVNGVPVALNPGSLLPGTQVPFTASGLAYSRVTQTYDGTVSLMNSGTSSLSGGLQVVFLTLQTGVHVTNGTGTFGGYPYTTISSILSPGGSASVNVQIKNAANSIILLAPLVYSGSFD